MGFDENLVNQYNLEFMINTQNGWKRSVRLFASGLFAVCILAFSSISAQESAVASGGNAQGNGGSVSFSIGQVLYLSSSESASSLVQGVQQPYEISIVSGVDEPDGIQLMLSVYPNPTSDFLYLVVGESFEPSAQSLAYQLYDIKGSLLESKKLEGSETRINMVGKIPSTYLLKVVDGSKTVKTFKIIKK